MRDYLEKSFVENNPYLSVDSSKLEFDYPEELLRIPKNLVFVRARNCFSWWWTFNEDLKYENNYQGSLFWEHGDKPYPVHVNLRITKQKRIDK